MHLAIVRWLLEGVSGLRVYPQGIAGLSNHLKESIVFPATTALSAKNLAPAGSGLLSFFARSARVIESLYRDQAPEGDRADGAEKSGSDGYLPPCGNERKYAQLREAQPLVPAEEYDHQQLQAKLFHLAFHDQLTDLGNQAFLLDVVKLGLSINDSRIRSFLFYIDLDRFRAVNSLLGHTVGDQLLREVALRLRRFVGTDDVLVRLSGDEFAILFNHIVDNGAAATLAESILERLEEPAVLEGTYFPISASIGICEVDHCYPRLEEVIHDADNAMYRAKREGGNRYAFYDRSMRTNAVNTIQTALQLRSAVDNNELELYYQPIIDMRDMTIVGVESLLRWNHPTRGTLSPDAFVPLAEEGGTIVSIGAWALWRALQDFQKLQGASDQELLLSVNISGKQLEAPGFAGEVVNLIRENRIRPDLVQLEVTESVFLGDADKAGDLLQSLRSKGIRIAIDDFGTGYSSLSYLQRFPIDMLKIDQSFVRGIHKGNMDTTIVRLLVNLSRESDIDVMAEGVECVSQSDALLQYGCHLGQGYLYSRPIPLDSMLSLLEQGLQRQIRRVS